MRLGVAVLMAVAGPGAAVAQVPQAVVADPAADAAHPARIQALTVAAADGALMNGVAYLPAGAGPHPAVLLLHGLPGYDGNHDLAQAMRRAGYTVVTFHPRGMWGSAGRFSLAHVAEDAASALAAMLVPGNAAAWRLDPARIAVVGHSMGGWAAARLSAADARVRGVALIAPWDVEVDAERLRRAPVAMRGPGLAAAMADVPGRVGATTMDELAAEMAAGDGLALAPAARGLAARPVLLLLAAQDTESCRATRLLPALRAAGARVTAADMPTEHSFSSVRIALAGRLVRWLNALPGAGAEARP